MANPTGKRGNPAHAASELELIELRRVGQLTEAQMESINPYFEEFKQALHDEWEKCGLDEGHTAKILHFHLKTVKELQRLMKLRTVRGKQATNKLEEHNG